MTSTLEQKQNNRVYLSVVQGQLCQKVDEGTPNARRREWEAGGKSGVKWEMVYDAVSGRIEEVSIYEGDSDGRKFTSLNVVLEENADGKQPVVTVGVDTRYAQDIMKKLPNVDLTEEVRIRPFSFQPEGEDKNVTGVEITQRHPVSGNFEKKITSYFHKKVGDKTEAVNGFPIPGDDVYDSDDWKVYFTQVKKFLVNYTKEHISPKLEGDIKKEKVEDYPTEEISPDDIPF